MNHGIRIILLLSAILFTSTLNAASITVDVNEGREKSWAVLPYAFKTENLGFAYGLAGGTFGYGQPQMSIYGAVMATSNKSYGIFFAVNEMNIPGLERLFLTTSGSAGWYTQYREYIQGHPLYESERAGANDSDKNNYLTGEGWNNFLKLKFRYVLPVGAGKDHIVNVYRLDRGILVDGSTRRGRWNPFESGRTYLEIEPFFHWQSFDSEFRSFEEYTTCGIGLGLLYDNTDFFDNPMRGSKLAVKVMRDPGTGSNTSSWTAVETEAAKYFSLGENRFFRKQTIGLDFWTAYSPTWEEVIDDGRTRVINRPPDYYGARLGGFYRMRAFPDKRFHDKAGIYYCLEYRVMPQWQPLPEIKWIRPFEVDWWQVVFFAEAGRVAPAWNLAALHERMKMDAGISIRMLIMRSVGRLDIAVSDEGASVKVFVGHPF